LPSTRATKSFGTATRSSVDPRTNSPGCKMKTPSRGISTSSVRSVMSFFTSMMPAVWLRNTRNRLCTLISMLLGCTHASSNGSMMIRPAASSVRRSRSDRITNETLPNAALDAPMNSLLTAESARLQRAGKSRGHLWHHAEVKRQVSLTNLHNLRYGLRR